MGGLDVFTHFLVPYTAALFALGLPRRAARGALVDTALRENRVALAVVFGLAGFSPDLDGGYSFLKTVDGLWWLQHRGASHSLVGAPVHAFVLVGLLHGLASWRPARFGRFRFRWVFVPLAIAGSWTHLVLDGITYAGVPMFWPFGVGRVAFPLFHWIVTWLFPAGAVLVGLHLWGKVGVRGMGRAGVVFLLVLLLLAGVRLHYRPDVEAGTWVYPRADMTEWTVIERVDGTNASVGDVQGKGYRVWLVRSGERTGPTSFFPDDPDPDAKDALRRARDTDAYRGFRMGAFGPVAVTTEPFGGAGWNVTFTSVAQRFEALHEPRWTPTGDPHEDWGYVRLRVAETVTPLHLGW